MKATIITIGDEILIGQIVDTNSVSIARHLNAAGIVVHEKVSIGDDSAQIVGCVERALGQSDIAIITGGLGPTKDDITKKTLAEMFGSELIPNQTVSDHVKRMLEERGIEFNDLNRGQGLVPACCTVLFNAHGTAPGMWFERGGKVVVSLPGVPYEMEHLMQDEVMPRLKAHFELRQIVHRTMITAGLPESMLAKAIETWENALPPYLKLAYLPNPGAVRLRLSAYEVEGESVSKEIERQFEALRRIIPHNIIGYETATMQELIHKLLTERRQTLATAESCTGGTIAARFTAMPGASAYFLCGVVSYSNASKQAVLGVDPDTIARYGAVSEQVARQMAEGARRISGLRRLDHRHRRPRGRYGRKARRHGMDRRRRPPPHGRPAQTVRLRPRTDHRPRRRLRPRSAARRTQRKIKDAPMNKILLSTATAFILSLTACSSHAPEKRVHRILTDRIQTLAVAESCTGGTIAARFTALPGASAYFKCGVVAYSLDTKQEILQISCDTIARYGAVSEQVVRQMAEGVRRASNSHYAVATTGIAGPTGGTPEYPVGSVWIAVSSPLRTTTRLIRAGGSRNAVIRKAGTAAIELLEEELRAANQAN